MRCLTELGRRSFFYKKFKKLLALVLLLIVMAIVVFKWHLTDEQTHQDDIQRSLETRGTYSFQDSTLSQVCYVPYYGNIALLRPLVSPQDFFFIKLWMGGLDNQTGDTAWWIIKIYDNQTIKLLEVSNNLYPKIQNTVCTHSKRILRSNQQNAQTEQKIYFDIDEPYLSSHPQQ